MIPSPQSFFCSGVEKAGPMITHVYFPALPFPWAQTYFLAFEKIIPPGFIVIGGTGWREDQIMFWGDFFFLM